MYSLQKRPMQGEKLEKRASCTGLKLFIGPKVQCMFVLKFALQRGEKGGSANLKTKTTHTEPFIQEYPAVYTYIDCFDCLF